MAKPTDIPTWCTDSGSDPLSGQPNILKPPASKLLAGWHYLEKMPRNWLNWWMNRVGQWCDYANTLESNALTWTGTHTFSQTPVYTETIEYMIAAADMIVDGTGGWDFTTAIRWDQNVSSSANDYLLIPLRLEVGDEVTAATVYMNVSAGNAECFLAKVSMAGSETILSDATASVGTGELTVAITGISSDPVSEGDAYYIVVDPQFAGTGRNVEFALIAITRSIS